MHAKGLLHERRNSTALTMELRLSCINPLMYATLGQNQFIEIGVKIHHFLSITYNWKFHLLFCSDLSLYELNGDISEFN